MPAPICVNCQLEMYCQQNDYIVNDVQTSAWPSTCWMGDMFKCLKCDIEIIVGTGIGMDCKAVDRLSDEGSLTFAHGVSQLKRFSSQFRKPKEEVDA